MTATRSRTRRTVAISLVVLGCALAVALIMIVAALVTPLGTRAAVRIAERIVPGLSIEQAGGAPTRTIALRGLLYRNESIDVAIDALELELDVAAIAAGRWEIDRIFVAGASVAFAANDAAAPRTEPLPAPVLPRIPAGVAVRSLAANDVAIRGLGPDVMLVALAGTVDGSRIAIERLDVRAAGYAAELAADLEMTQQIAGRLEGSVRELAPDGSMAQFAAMVDIAADEDPWVARIEWDRLDWGASPLGDLSSPRGRLIAALGSVPIRVQLDARIEGAALPTPADIAAELSIANFDVVEIARLRRRSIGRQRSAHRAAPRSKRAARRWIWS